MRHVDFSKVGRSRELVDERGRLMRFPNRRDYVDYLVVQNLISDEFEFTQSDDLTEDVYFDWLRRGQVGCVFAQLLGRRKNRVHGRTVVLREQAALEKPVSLARQVDVAAQDAVSEETVESISILLPTILNLEALVTLLLELSRMPRWKVEREPPWRKTLVLVGLRFQIEEWVWAEIVGLGPFDLLPPTRQSPVTSLELRTKSLGANRNKINPKMRAAHVARIPTHGFLTRQEHAIRFSKWTKYLRLRMLGGTNDMRAKAKVTFAVPAAMWELMKPRTR